MEQRDIILKLNPTTSKLTKLTATNPIKGSQAKDVYYLYAPFGNNAALINFLPNRFIELTGVNPVPAIKMTQEIDDEVIQTKLGDDYEVGWSLYYLQVGPGISGILQSQQASKYEVSFTELEIDVDDADYLGEYATASTVEATIISELESNFASRVSGNYVNVYLTTTNVYSSWLYNGSTWVDQNELINEQISGNTQQYIETFKGTVFSNDTFNMGTPEAQALVLNQIYGELQDLYSLVAALTGGSLDFMRIEDYATEGTATESVKYARNVGTDGDSKPYAEIEFNTNKGQPSGYAPLDSNSKVPRANLPDGTKVFKGDFGAIAGDLPTVGVENGDTYRCDSDNYTSAVSGLTYDTNDTATWNGTSWITNQSSSIDSVNNILPDANGDVLLRANNINRQDDSETIEDTLDRLEDGGAQYNAVTQGGATNNEFYRTAVNTTLFDRRIERIDISDIAAGSGPMTYSIDGNVTKTNVVDFNDNNLLLESFVARGEHIDLVLHDSKWRVVNTDGDWDKIIGNNWAGSTLTEVEAEQDVQNSRLDAVEQALATPGENILQSIDMTIPFAASGTLQKLTFDTLGIPSNDTAYLDVNVNNDQVVVAVESPGINFTGNFEVEKTAGSPQVPYTVVFYLFNDADPKIVANAIDSITVTSTTTGIANDRSKTITLSDTQLTALGLPATLVVYYSITSGVGQINAGSVNALTLFSSEGIPIPTVSNTVTISNTTVEMLSGFAGAKQSDANAQFVDKFAETGKVNDLLYVSAGQFKIDLSSPLVNMNSYLFKVGATNDTDDAQVSVDNGVTYYDLKVGTTDVNMKANEIGGEIVQVYYDGTDFRFIDYNEPIPITYSNGAVVGSTKNSFTSLDFGSPSVDLIKAVSPEQLVDNGDFSNGTTNWTALNTTSFTVIDGVASVVDDGTAIGRIQMNIPTLQQGNDYAIILDAKCDTATTARIRFTDVSAQDVNVALGTDFERTTTIFTASQNPDIFYISALVANSTLEINYLGILPLANKPYASESATELSQRFPTYVPYDINDPDFFEIKTTGVQLFDGEFDSNITGLEYKQISNTQFSIKGLTSGDIGKNIFPNIKFKENTQYTFSGSVFENDDSKNTRLRIEYTDGTNADLFIPNLVNTSFSVTSTNGKTIIHITYNCSGSGGTTTITNFMVNEGTTAETYRAYNSLTAFKVPVGISVGTSQDETYLDQDVWKIKRNNAIDTTVVKNATTWLVRDELTNTIVFYKDLQSTLGYKLPASNSTTANVKLIADTLLFNASDVDDMTTNDVEAVGLRVTGGSEIWIRINKSRLGGILSSDFETWLQGLTSCTLRYELATTTYETVDADGSTVQEKWTQIVQLSDWGMDYDMSFALNDKENGKQNTIKIAENEKEISALENEVATLQQTISSATLQTYDTIFGVSQGDTPVIFDDETDPSLVTAITAPKSILNYNRVQVDLGTALATGKTSISIIFMMPNTTTTNPIVTVTSSYTIALGITDRIEVVSGIFNALSTENDYKDIKIYNAKLTTIDDTGVSVAPISTYYIREIRGYY